jgi:glycosyltransferase involved in cell wall biosynthesis
MSACIQRPNIKPAAARRYVEENFSIENMVQGYVNVYRETLELTATEKIA